MTRCGKPVVGVSTPFGLPQTHELPCVLEAEHDGPCAFVKYEPAKLRSDSAALEALLPRRACFEGALQDVIALERALANLESGDATPESFASWARAIFGVRRELLELAIRQFDEAVSLRGKEEE